MTGESASVVSDDRLIQQRIPPKTRPSMGSARGLNGLSLSKRAVNESQVLESSLADLLRDEAWESIAQADDGKSVLFSEIKTKLQKQLEVLTYVNGRENGANPTTSNHDLVSPREATDIESPSSKRTREYINHVNSERESDTSSEWKLEVKRWKRVDGRTGSIDIYDDSHNIEDIRKREREIQGGRNVLNVFDVYDSEGSECQTFLEISSGPLIDLLREVITFYPGEDWDVLRGGRETKGNNAVVFSDPFVMLFAYRKKLEERLEGDSKEDSKKHLRVLLDFLKTEHPDWSSWLTKIEEGQAVKLPYHALWLLFSPNTPVYVRDGTNDRQVVVYSREFNFHRTWLGTTKAVSIEGPMTLKCWDVKFKHGAFKRMFSEFAIEPYSGVRRIDQLPLVPEKYMPNEPEVKNRLIARGQKYYDLKLSARMQDYNGDCFPRVFKDEPVRVVADEDNCRKKIPYLATPDDTISETYGFPPEEVSLVDENKKPLATTLLRCFPKVGVFSLRDRKWDLVQVDDLEPVKFREKAFSKLVIKKEYKNLLKSLVRAYMEERAYFRDIVPGKGRGIAILLHGPPGTGKTLTAECVAEREECPLYTVSCGDLGTEPEQLEARLKEVFEHAIHWKAILLLDEADIFLQERNMNDLKRNALVTIFLRELEYFDGIIFMTTNRPGDIDEAFVSRMHVTIELSQPQQEDRSKMWKMFIKDLDMPEEAQKLLYTAATKKFGGEDLNGRQIRNIVRVALTLAKSRNSHVTLEDLEEVVKNSRKYAQYNENLNKMTPEELAINQGKRAAFEEEESD